MNDYCRYKNGPTVKCRVPMVPVVQMSNNCRENVCEYAVEQFASIDGLPLAMAYVPFQKFNNLYEVDAAFAAGTLFKELDKPFIGRCRK